MPTAEQLEWFLKTVVVQGLGLVFMTGFAGLILYGTFRITMLVVGIFIDAKRWIPKAVAGYLSFVENIKTTNVQQAEASGKVAQAVGAMTASHAVSSDNHGKTHRALTHIVKAQQLTHLSPEAQDELKLAIDELKSK